MLTPAAVFWDVKKDLKPFYCLVKGQRSQLLFCLLELQHVCSCISVCLVLLSWQQRSLWFLSSFTKFCTWFLKSELQFVSVREIQFADLQPGWVVFPLLALLAWVSTELARAVGKLHLSFTGCHGDIDYGLHWSHLRPLQDTRLSRRRKKFQHGDWLSSWH